MSQNIGYCLVKNAAQLVPTPLRMFIAAVRPMKMMAMILRVFPVEVLISFLLCASMIHGLRYLVCLTVY